jgi:hypothetical protein
MVVCHSGRDSALALTTMRENDFRRIALGMEGAVEGAHMGHPDFRVNNRIFATLHQDRSSAWWRSHQTSKSNSRALIPMRSHPKVEHGGGPDLPGYG